MSSAAILKLLGIDKPIDKGRKIPPPPPHLDEQAREKWNELYSAHGGKPDALAAYCVAWSRWTKAEAELKTLGPVVKSPSGYPIQNPWLGIANKAADELRRWGKILGITNKT